jgi:carbon-monoxide dehydrogenase small subunit
VGKSVSLKVNGRQVSGEVDPRRLLVEFLREDLRLTGTHVGCDTSQCGACTVLLNGKSVKSCTVLAVQAQGAEVRTIEDIAGKTELHPVQQAFHEQHALHPVQQAFHEQHALQCGFCTPGMVISVIDLLRRIPAPTEEEVRWNLEGNLCRCTGYHNIVKAVQAAAKTLAA